MLLLSTSLLIVSISGSDIGETLNLIAQQGFAVKANRETEGKINAQLLAKREDGATLRIEYSEVPTSASKERATRGVQLTSAAVKQISSLSGTWVGSASYTTSIPHYASLSALSGDYFVTVRVSYPTTISEAEQGQLTNFAELVVRTCLNELLWQARAQGGAYTSAASVDSRLSSLRLSDVGVYEGVVDGVIVQLPLATAKAKIGNKWVDLKLPILRAADQCHVSTTDANTINAAIAAG